MGRLYCKKDFYNDYAGVDFLLFAKGKYYNYIIEQKSYILDSDYFPFVSSKHFVEEYFTTIKDIRTDKLDKLDGY